MLGYAGKCFGWFLAGLAVALGFLLVPLQVAAERKKLDRIDLGIRTARHEIRALETEFDTRANLAQLERWNGDTLRLTVPTAAQFIADPAALAALDVRHPGPDAASLRTAALVVPEWPAGDLGGQASAVLQTISTGAVPAETTNAAAATAVRGKIPTAPAERSDRATLARAATAGARALAQSDRQQSDRFGEGRLPTARPQAVAMLERNLLSDATMGDLLTRARSERGSGR